MSMSVPAPLSLLRHAVGWEALTFRTLASCLLDFLEVKLAGSRLHH
jgi:hypothetical protein